MEREEILQNLYEARNIIHQAEAITQNYNNLKSQLISEKSYTKIDDRLSSKISNKANGCLVTIIKIWFYSAGIIAIISPLFTGDMRGVNNVANVIAGIVIIALTYFGFKFLKKWQKARTEYKDRKGLLKVMQKNEQIAEQNAPINEQIEQVNQDMQYIRQVADEHLYWYPRSYCYTDAVNYFIEVIANYRADTLKEAVNLYVEELRHRQMLDAQQQLIYQQKVANVLSAANLFVNLSTLSAVNQNTAAINQNTAAINSGFENNRQAINNAASRVQSTINSAADRIRRKF